MPENKRLPALDLLRFIAVTAVIATHSYALSDYVYGPWLSGISGFMRYGWIGVDLFFVLSGFLVSGLLFQEYQQTGSLRVKRFLIRRGFKIYPALYFLLLCSFIGGIIIASVTGKPSQLSYKNYLAEIFFVQNYFPGVWSQTWSLAVEEHFYLSFPILLMILIAANRSAENPFRLLKTVFLAIVAATIVFNIIFWRMPGSEEADFVSWTYTLTHTRIDSILFGAMLSYYYHFEPAKLLVFRKLKFLWLVLAVGILVAVLGGYLELIGAATGKLMYCAFGIILLISIFSSRVEAFASSMIGKWLTFIGQHSYSIYLWHKCVLFGTLMFFEIFGITYDQILLVNLIYFVLAPIVGIVMAKLVEIPMLRLRDRLFGDSRTAGNSRPMTHQFSYSQDRYFPGLKKKDQRISSESTSKMPG
jgi:peptidoglycan/LPS O-acetylase OafA/YrhL